LLEGVEFQIIEFLVEGAMLFMLDDIVALDIPKENYIMII